jgi:epoxyqueuosine reductase QueG
LIFVDGHCQHLGNISRFQWLREAKKTHAFLTRISGAAKRTLTPRSRIWRPVSWRWRGRAMAALGIEDRASARAPLLRSSMLRGAAASALADRRQARRRR